VSSDFAYIDTCVIGCHAEGRASGAPAREVAIRSRLEAILASGIKLAVSELGLIEYHDMLMKKVRDTHTPIWDETWGLESLAATMALIRSGALTVISAPSNAPEQAIQLMVYATRKYGLAFKLWDAMHLVIATNWAYELGHPVELLTADHGFAKFVDTVPAFKQLVTLVDLNPPEPEALPPRHASSPSPST
jgi:hypothetical protein